MSNMSYCRFQNTSLDMKDCLDALEEQFEAGRAGPDEDNEEAPAPLSREEFRALCDLVETASNLLRTIGDNIGEDIDDLADMDPAKIADRLGQALNPANN